MELRIRQLATHHPDCARALRDVTLAVPLGVCGLLGPAGAGKSTLLRVLASRQVPAAGSAHLGEVDLLGRSEGARRAVGYLPQDDAPTCKAGAADVLIHYAEAKGIAGYQARRDIVEALLHQVGLQDAQREPPGRLPDGMRRRFGLAVALLGRPPLLLLDAPLAGLAGDERTGILTLLADLGRHHIVLMATRDVADVAAVCTHLALLERGTLRLASALRPSPAPARPQPSGILGSTIFASCISDCCHPT